MRMRKIVEAKERPTLEAAAKEFLAIKQAQMLSDETMHDYQAQLERFVCGSRNSTEYSLLEQDTLAFFAAIPDTSPARYNKPYQYISAFFNWMVRQEYIPKNPITANELKKRRDEGNIKPVSVSGARTVFVHRRRGDVVYHQLEAGAHHFVRYPAVCDHHCAGDDGLRHPHKRIAWIAGQ